MMPYRVLKICRLLWNTQQRSNPALLKGQDPDYYRHILEEKFTFHCNRYFIKQVQTSKSMFLSKDVNFWHLS